jgi:hypothetical protein
MPEGLNYKTKHRMPKLNREELTESIYYLLKKVEEKKGELSRPIVDIFSMVVFPWIIYFLFSKLFDFSKTFDMIYEPYYQVNKDAYISSTQNYGIAKNFLSTIESGLVDLTKNLFGYDPVWKKELGITNIKDESTWPFPYKFEELPTVGEKHLLFQLAKYTEKLFQLGVDNADKTKVTFLKILNVLIMGRFKTDYNTPIDFLQRFPEFGSREFSTKAFSEDPRDVGQVSTLQIAEMFRYLYPEFQQFNAIFHAKIEELSRNLAFFPVLYVQYLFGLFLTIPAKMFFLNRLFQSYFPLNWFLHHPVKKNNYYLLEQKGLQEEKKKLERSLEALTPYVDSARKLSTGIKTVVAGCTVYLLMEEGAGFIGDWLAYTLLITFVINKAFSVFRGWRSNVNLTEQLNAIKNRLNDILGNEVKHCVSLEAVEYEELAFSCVKMNVKKDLGDLSKNALAEIFNNMFSYFGIETIPFYARTQIGLSGLVALRKVSAMKDYLVNAIKRTNDTNALGKQIDRIVEQISQQNIFIEEGIETDHRGLNSCVYRIDLSKEMIDPLEKKLSSYGFIRETSQDKNGREQLVLRKNEAYSEQEFALLFKNIKDFIAELSKKAMPSFVVNERSEVSYKPVEKGAVEVTVEKNEEIVPEKTRLCSNQITSSLSENIDVRKVTNALNTFIVWNLSKKDFGHYQDYYDIFHEKAEKIARANLAESGIKMRPVRCRGQLFPAYVKVAGSSEVGDVGVPLTIEINENGDRVFKTSHVQFGIH